MFFKLKMNNISLLFWIIIILRIKTETISLKYSSNNYYIPIKIGQKKEYEYFLLSNILPINIFPSSECKVCKSYHINEKDNNTYTIIKNNVTIPYYYNNYTGSVYKSNLTLGSETNLIPLLAFDNITYVKSYYEKGCFSLSFLNYFFNTPKKIFALSLGSENGNLEIGDYSHNKIKDKSKFFTFNITKTNYTNEYLNYWYINFNSLSINKNNLEKNNYKLTFDAKSSNFHIPKDIFFKYAHYIFSEDSKCQIQPEGYFTCVCEKNFEKNFGNFIFFNDNNEYIEVKINDYIAIDETDSENTCYILIEINYDSDLFIAGKYIMNNYYSIFDIDNNQLKLYYSPQEYYYFDQRNVIVFLLVLCSGGLAFLCCYFIYKKFFSRNENIEENLNEDLMQENGEDINENSQNENRESDNNIEMNNENNFNIGNNEIVLNENSFNSNNENYNNDNNNNNENYI